jgi:myo-inositol-1(or 4)-monophosphatase
MSVNSPDELLAVAEGLAIEAAAFVVKRRTELVDDSSGLVDSDSVRTKSSRTDPVTLADTETERLLRARLAELRPEDSVLGEEGGGSADGGGAAVRWVLDPIDGTVNFLYGIPAYAVSIAAQVDGISVAGAVADVAAGDVYSAAVGRGAHLLGDGRRRALRCSSATELSMALIGTGFGYSPQRRAAQGALLSSLLPLVRDVRRIGSAALDLCMVAAGRLDGHYEHGLNLWDWAAAALIATEAGADLVLPTPNGSAGTGKPLIASAPGITTEFLAMLAEVGATGELP